MIRILLVIPLAVALVGPPVASACPPDWDVSSPVGWSDSGALLLERDATHWDDEGSPTRSEHYEVVQLGRNPRCIDLNGTSAEFLPCRDVRRVPMTDWYEDVDEPEGPTPVERMRNAPRDR